MGETSSSPTITTQLQRIAEQAKQYPALVFTTLAHLLDVDFLREAYRRTLTVLWQWCRAHRHRKVEEQHQELCQKLRGHYQYYSLRGNYRLLKVLRRHAERAWRCWLSRRSQKGTITGNQRERWRAHFPLPTPRIVHNI